MQTYLITYDLHQKGQDYKSLIEKIKTYGNWWHCLESTWIVRTASSSANIRNYLSPHIDTNDELLVVKLSGEGAWKGFSKECSDWLLDNL